MAIGEGNAMYFPGGPSGAVPRPAALKGETSLGRGRVSRVPCPKALASSWLACGARCHPPAPPVSRAGIGLPEAADSVTHSHGSRSCVHRASRGWGWECLTAEL